MMSFKYKRINFGSVQLGILPALLVILFLEGCLGSKPLPYFSGSIDSVRLRDIPVPDQVIQRGDLIGISVFSDNPEATAIFNQASVSAGTPSTLQPMKGVGSQVTSTGSSGGGYLVDNGGNIRMHAIGVIHAEGMTKEMLARYVTDSLERLGVLKNPYCVVRFNNFKITVLGEVRTPGVFTVPGEQATVLEALGLAGDITDFGRKEKVMLIREDQGKRTYATLNLLDNSIFSSPYFYLHQNDVLVVEPDSKKPTAADVQTLQYVTTGAAVVSAIAILITLLKK